MTKNIKISKNISSALDTIAHHLSTMWPEASMWGDFYQIDFRFDRKTDLDEDEILANDEFWILTEKENYDWYSDNDELTDLTQFYAKTEDWAYIVTPHDKTYTVSPETSVTLC